MIERTEADADAQIGFAAKRLNEWEDDFANGDWILAGLDVHVCHAGGTVVDKEFGQLVVLGAEAFQRAIAAAHAAIGAVFAAVIGYFNDAADENLVPESCTSSERSFLMKRLLSFAVQIQHVGAWQSRLNHCRKIEPGGGECK